MAGALFNYFADSLGRREAAGEGASTSYSRIRFDGWQFERWFLKTAINLSLANGIDIGGVSAEQPVPMQLLASVFGETRLMWPRGLYFVARDGQVTYSDDTFKFTPISSNIVGLALAAFSFRGYRFLLNLHSTLDPSKRAELRSLGSEWQDVSMIYRPNSIRYSIAANHVHEVFLSW